MNKNIPLFVFILFWNNLFSQQTASLDSCTLSVSAVILANESCEGAKDGMAEAQIIGGTPPFSYQWNAAADSQTTAIVDSLSGIPYIFNKKWLSVIVTDSMGCSDTSTASIRVEGPSQYVQPYPGVVICNGDSSAILLFNIAPVNYLWSTGDTTNMIDPIPPGSYSVIITDTSSCVHKDTFDIIDPPVLTANLVVTNGSCDTIAGIEAIPTGGVPPYTYSWSNGETIASISNIETGTYSLQIRDENYCIIQKYASVTDYVFDFHLDTSNTGCGTGGATIAVVSDTGIAVSYLWSNGDTTATITGLNSGNYSVEVMDTAGCFRSDSVDIALYPLPTIIAPPDTQICLGEQITLIGSGGIMYNWNNGVIDSIAFSPMVSKVYTLIGTDSNGCQNSDLVSITVNPLPTINIAGDTVVCFGDNTELTASGGQLYSWDNGIFNGISFLPDSSNQYTVTVIDSNGCTNIDSLFILVFDSIPVASFSYELNGLELQLTDTSEFTDKWYWTIHLDSDTVQNPIYIFDESGEYEVCLIAGNTCFNDTLCESVLVEPNGLNDSKLMHRLSTFPNPARDEFRIKFKWNIYTRLELYNSIGRRVTNYEIIQSNDEILIRANKLPRDLYFISIVQNEVVIGKSSILLK